MSPWLWDWSDVPIVDMAASLVRVTGREDANMVRKPTSFLGIAKLLIPLHASTSPPSGAFQKVTSQDQANLLMRCWIVLGRKAVCVDYSWWARILLSLLLVHCTSRNVSK